MEKTVDEGSSRWSNKYLIYAFISLLFGSNILNTYINQQNFNTIEIVRTDKANRRRLEHSEKKTALKNEIIMLEYKLKQCNEK